MSSGLFRPPGSRVYFLLVEAFGLPLGPLIIDNLIKCLTTQMSNLTLDKVNLYSR